MTKKFFPGEKVVENYDRKYNYGVGISSIDQCLCSTVFGIPQKLNTIIISHPLFYFKYTPNVGDIVIGRIVEIFNKKWKVDCNSYYESTLSLGAIFLPGDVQRRKSKDDETGMRYLYQVNDIVVCEVQKITKNSTVALNPYTGKYNSLNEGILFKVPIMLIKKNKSVIELTDCVVIVGSNGYVWIKTANYDIIGSFHQYINDCIYHKQYVDFATFFSKYTNEL